MQNITVACALKYAIDFLKQHSHELTYHSPVFEAKLIICSCLGLSQSELIIFETDSVTTESFASIKYMLKRRINGEPMAYILKYQPFWTLYLEVSRDTLIPRSDTETMIEAVLGLSLPKFANALDLGTGTGAIALALKSERQNWEIEGCDFKASIVELAQRNARRHSLEVNFYVSNWFENVGSKRFDLILSNPPYVEPDSPYLQQGDLRFEPDSALISEDMGFADIKRIISASPLYLKKSGVLMLEHGHTQSKEIQTLMERSGFCNTKTCKDINGLDRITFAVFDKPL